MPSTRPTKSSANPRRRGRVGRPGQDVGIVEGEEDRVHHHPAVALQATNARHENEAVAGAEVLARSGKDDLPPRHLEMLQVAYVEARKGRLRSVDRVRELPVAALDRQALRVIAPIPWPGGQVRDRGLRAGRWHGGELRHPAKGGYAQDGEHHLSHPGPSF